MEQIAVYIIIIVILIVSSMRKSKKQQQAKIDQLKRQQQLQEGDTGYQGETLEDIFKKLSGDIFEDQPTQVPEIQMVEQNTIKKEPFLNYELQNHAKRQSAKPQRRKIVHEENYFEKMLKDQETAEQTESEFDTDIDWGKAVIYSEILNRKYV
jgi:heme exporter protein D